MPSGNAPRKMMARFFNFSEINGPYSADSVAQRFRRAAGLANGFGKSVWQTRLASGFGKRDWQAEEAGEIRKPFPQMEG